MKVLGIILIIFGFLGALAEGCSLGSGRADYPFTGIVLALSFAVGGHAAFMYSRVSYKGGATSIIGSILLWFGVVAFAMKVESYFLGDSAELWSDVVALLVFAVLGVVLLIAGHGIHKERTERDEQRDPDS